VFPSSTAVWHDRYYHVDFVIGPEKTDPVWVDVKHPVQAEALRHELGQAE
jgi:hypothetical protein